MITIEIVHENKWNNFLLECDPMQWAMFYLVHTFPGPFEIDMNFIISHLIFKGMGREV